MSGAPNSTGAPTWAWAGELLATVSAARGWTQQAYDAVSGFLGTVVDKYDETDRAGWAVLSAYLAALPESYYPGSSKLAATYTAAVTELDDAAVEAAEYGPLGMLWGTAAGSASDVADIAQGIRDTGAAIGEDIQGAARSGWFLPAGIAAALGGAWFLWGRK